MGIPDDVVLFDQGVLWSLAVPLNLDVTEGLTVSVLIVSEEGIQGSNISCDKAREDNSEIQILTHSYLETHKRIIDKHCRPRSDAI